MFGGSRGVGLILVLTRNGYRTQSAPFQDNSTARYKMDNQPGKWSTFYNVAEWTKQ